MSHTASALSRCAMSLPPLATGRNNGPSLMPAACSHALTALTGQLVTPRAMAIVSSYGFSPSPTPSQHSPIRGAAEVGYLIKESVEVAVGRIIGFGTLSSLDHS